MQLANYGNAAQVVGVQHTQSFQMQMNAKMFSILTDKLYQNKEGAVIRELSANARDAHVAAGRGEVPFDITLPSWLSNEFKIRDYGTGINPEEFYDIYTNLGHSTKDHEDTSIGAYGLGSKTPFAITDQYTIRNFWQGTVHVYTAFKDTGMPTVSLIGSEPTDEDNGLEISVDITDNGNSSSFKRQCAEQLAYFDVKPNIIGVPDFEWNEIPELGTGYNVKSGHYGSDITIVMGGIPYTSSVRGLPDELQTSLRRIELVLVAQLGEVDIPPSRESLEFTPKTIKFLWDKLEEIKEDYVIDFAYQIENAKDEVELHGILLSRVSEWISNKEFAITPFRFENQDMLGTDLDNVVDKTIPLMTCKENSRHYKVLKTQNNGASVSNILRVLRGYRNHNNEGEVYINDLSPRANKFIVENKHLLKAPSPVIFPTEQKTKLFAAAAMLVKVNLIKLGFKPVLLSSLMTMPLVVKGSGTKAYSKPDQIFRVDTRGNVNKTTLTQLPQEGYFVTMSNWNTSQSPQYLSCIINDLGKEVYALRSHAQMAVSKSDKWTSVHKLEAELHKVLSTKLKESQDSIKKLEDISLVANCTALFDTNMVKVSESINKNSKIAKLIKGCSLIQEDHDNKTLSFRQENVIRNLKIVVQPSKAKVPADLMRFAKQAKENYSESLSACFYYNRYSSEKPGLLQTLNLIVGNFK